VLAQFVCGVTERGAELLESLTQGLGDAILHQRISSPLRELGYCGFFAGKTAA
jgi:hypothetical protein